MSDNVDEIGSFESSPRAGGAGKQLYLYIGIVVVVLLGLVWTIAGVMSQGDGDAPVPEMKVDSKTTGKLGASPAATGKESEAYVKEVHKFNEGIESGEIKDHHPIPIQDERIVVNPQNQPLDDYGLYDIQGVDGATFLNQQQAKAAEQKQSPRAQRQNSGQNKNPKLDDLVGVLDRVVYTPSLSIVSYRDDEGKGQSGDAGEADGNWTPPDAEDLLDQENSEEKGYLIDAMTLVYGVSNIALNSDYEGPVWLTVVGALGGNEALADAQLLGEMVNLGEKVRLELKVLKLADGRTYDVDAIALDPDTTYAAVATSVDRHVLYRFGWWGVGVALQAAGKAASEASTEVAVSDGVVIQSRELDGRKEALVAAGELGRELGNTFRDRINRPPTVHVAQGQPLGVFFLDDVKE